MTSSATPARVAARKHSALSASMPFTITERIILIDEARPTSPATTRGAIGRASSTGAIASAWGPETSSGTMFRFGCTGAITATSR